MNSFNFCDGSGTTYFVKLDNAELHKAVQNLTYVIGVMNKSQKQTVKAIIRSTLNTTPVGFNDKTGFWKDGMIFHQKDLGKIFYDCEIFVCFEHMEIQSVKFKKEKFVMYDSIWGEKANSD